MFANDYDLVSTAQEVYGPADLPKKLGILKAVVDGTANSDPSVTARLLHTTTRQLAKAVQATDPAEAILGIGRAGVDEKSTRRARSILGQLLLGVIAERAFERIYENQMGTDLKLQDDRAGYTETDYLILNGGDRPVFRLNIKFHGTLFLKAQEMVGLASDDCFALATYKIYQAEIREKNEVLPYVFAIVSVPGLTAEAAGAVMPERFVDFAALTHSSSLSGKRSIEDRIVTRVLAAPDAATAKAVDDFVDRVAHAQWRLISATKAKNLLLERLFERVYAVRVRAFARNYPNAELDMHLSLTDDLTPLEEFLQRVKERGLHGVTAYLSSGVY